MKSHAQASENIIKTSQFDLVCQLARDRNIAELKKIIVAIPERVIPDNDEDLCLLHPMRADHTPITQLAREGDDDAVAILLYDFNARPEDAVAGYAYAGLVERVDFWLDIGVSMNHAVYGYASAGRVDMVNKLIARGADINYAAYGYARAGATDRVEKLIALGVDLSWPIAGYALSGFKDKVENLLQRGGDINDAAFYYALGCFTERVNDLIQRGADMALIADAYVKTRSIEGVDQLLEYGFDKDQLVMWSARAGWIEMTDILIEKGAAIKQAAVGYAASGLEDNVNDLIKRGVDANYVLGFYVLCGWFSKMEKLVHGGASAWQAAEALENVNVFDNESSALRMLSQINAVDIRKYFANTAKVNHDDLDISSLLHHAAVINKLMHEHHFSYRQALTLLNHNEHTWQRDAEKIHKIMDKYQLRFHQARALQIKGLRPWLLQGEGWQRNSESGVLPHDLLIHISTFVTGLNHHDTEAIYSAVCKNTYNGALSRINENYQPGFFTKLFRLSNSDDAKLKSRARQDNDEAALSKRYQGDKGRRNGWQQ